MAEAMVSVEAERKRRPSRAVPVARATKECPFQPCPSRIPERWLACAYHWGFALPRYREGNKRGGKSDHWLWVYSTVLGLVSVCWALDEGGVPKPWESEQRRIQLRLGTDPSAPAELRALTERAGHGGRPGCDCDWCAPMYRWALKVAGVSEESWQMAVERHAP